MNKKITLKDLYSFPGFKASARLRPHPDHPGAMIVTLKRRQKKLFVRAVMFTTCGMTTGTGLFETLTQAIRPYIWNLRYAVSTATDVCP